MRSKRHLLTKAYRAAKRAGHSATSSRRGRGYAAKHFLEALKIKEMGKSIGVPVGGIVNALERRNEAINRLGVQQEEEDRANAAIAAAREAADPDPVDLLPPDVDVDEGVGTSRTGDTIYNFDWADEEEDNLYLDWED